MQRTQKPSRSAGTAVTSGARGPRPLEATQRPGGVSQTADGLGEEVKALREKLENEQAEVARVEATLAELFMRNACEEYLQKLERRIQVIENREVDTIHWRIEDIDDVRGGFSKGKYLASPTFSACGLDGFSFHLYPRGDDFADEGYCSLYFHVPAETTVSRTLFLGRAKHGPAEADSLKNCGISEMCVLSNQIDKETGSIVIGVRDLKVISSPHVVECRTKLTL